MSGNGYVIDNWGLLVALLMVAVAALVSSSCASASARR